MAYQYEPLTGEQAFDNVLSRRKWNPIWCFLLISGLLLLNGLSFLGGTYWSKMHDDIQPAVARDTTWKKFWWITEYSEAANRSHTDDLWAAILPSHGWIAVDRKYAKEKRWPQSMYLPHDKTKGVYLLEAYHYLYCLRILRTTLWEAIEQKPYTYNPPGAHSDHCFDAIRQYVVCKADSTPLYTLGGFTGDGQSHQCKNWSQLRDFATKNSACCRDSIEKIPLGDHFGFCDDGVDNVLELS